MALTYSGLRHLALCCLQTNVLFPCSRKAVLFAPDTRHRTPVHMISWIILHYIHMCSWKLSGITFTCLVYCSGLNFSEWSRHLRMCKYLIALCTCAFLCDECVLIASMFQNDLCNEPVITLWNGVVLLRNFTLCCLKTNVLPHWLVTSTLQCVPLLNKMSGYEGIISDILTIYWFLISLPFRSIEMVLQSTIHSLCWWIF